MGKQFPDNYNDEKKQITLEDSKINVLVWDVFCVNCKRFLGFGEKKDIAMVCKECYNRN